MRIFEEKLVKVYCGDCVEIMSTKISDNTVDLVVTSPPYSVGKEYEVGVSIEEHLELMYNTIEQVARVLKPGRVVCWNIASNPQRNTMLLHGMLLEKHLTFVDNIIWRKITGASPRFGTYMLQYSKEGKGRYYPNTVWEMIFVYSKGEPAFWGDMRADHAKQFRDDVWDFKGEQTLNRDHPAPFPAILASTCIQLYTLPGEVVLDPFLGSGTTCQAAKGAKRYSIGIEKDPAYFDKAVRHVQHEFYKFESQFEGVF